MLNIWTVIGLYFFTFLFRFLRKETVLFCIRCELLHSGGYYPVRRALVTTTSTRCTKVKQGRKTWSSNIGKIIVSKTKNDYYSLQIEIPDDRSAFKVIRQFCIAHPYCAELYA